MIVDMVVGDDGPALRYELEWLTVNPASATVAFRFLREDGTSVTLAGTATLSDISSQTVGSRTYYFATCNYAWEAADTATAGAYAGYFVVTLAAAAGAFTAPADGSLRVRIHPAAAPPAAP